MWALVVERCRRCTGPNRTDGCDAQAAGARSLSRTLGEYLSAERAEVLGVLADFNLLDLLPQTGPISGSVLPDDSDLFRTLGLQDTCC